MHEGDVRMVDVDPIHPQAEAIAAAAEVLVAGRPVVFPTDTVYGIGMVVLSGGDAGEIFEIKRRDRAQTLPWLVASVDALVLYGVELPKGCLALAADHWPGALTIVVRASEKVPAAYRAADGTIALRMPDSPVALSLVEAVGAPIATTSANLHGCPAAVSVAELDPELLARTPLVLDGGIIPSGVPSTVVSYADGAPKMIREGEISEKTILAYGR